MSKKIGIIDLGSNSVRLVIYEIKKNGAFKLIDDINDGIRLSENMVDGKYLNEVSMNKALRTIKLFSNLCTAYGISPSNTMAVATAAVRKAQNRDQFLSMLQNHTGLTFKLLSGEEEATYIYNAVIHSLAVDDGIIVDIGGGSTEIILFKKRVLKNLTCIPIGAVVATEDYLDRDIIHMEKLSKLENLIKEKLQNLDWISEIKSPVIIALGGTLRNLAKVHKKTCDYPLDQTHNYPVKTEDFYKIYDHLKAMDLKKRKSVPGLSSKRADIIVGGLTIFKALADITKAKNIVISGYGLREGILFEYLINKGHIKRYSDVLTLSLYNLMELYKVRFDHANHVSFIALSLFDQLSSLHGFGDEERNLLRVSSLLHDIGISISYYQHHSHAYYIVLNSMLCGLTHREIVLVSALCASHSMNDFKDIWKLSYKEILNEKDMIIYKMLSAILKISESLDRSETGIIKSLECQITDKYVKVKTLQVGDGELELSLANENAHIFNKVFGKNIVIS